jgi:hypothetical protein
MKRTSLSLLAAAAVLAGCHGASQEASLKDAKAAGSLQVQLNDVSTLLPLPKTDADLNALLKASASGKNGTLLPRTLTDPIAPTPRPGPFAVKDELPYDDLRVVGFRIDPCFSETDAAAADRAGTCVNQLRLIFQAFTKTDDGQFLARDSGFHALYKLTRPELLELVRAVVALRQENQRGIAMAELAPHAVVAAQGLQGPMARGLERLILASAGEKNLERFTRMVVTGIGAWKFDGFDVRDGVAVKTEISSDHATIPAGTLEQSNFTGLSGPSTLNNRFSPEMTDGLALIGSVRDSKAATAGERQAAFDVALQIENPSLTTAGRIDCASCHFAGPARKLVAEPQFGLTPTGNANAFQADKAFVNAREMLQTTSFMPTAMNVHAFSYLGKDAGINFRTINETAAVVTYLNGTLLVDPTPAPTTQPVPPPTTRPVAPPRPQNPTTTIPVVPPTTEPPVTTQPLPAPTPDPIPAPEANVVEMTDGAFEAHRLLISLGVDHLVWLKCTRSLASSASPTCRYRADGDIPRKIRNGTLSAAHAVFLWKTAEMDAFVRLIDDVTGRARQGIASMDLHDLSCTSDESCTFTAQPDGQELASAFNGND